MVVEDIIFNIFPVLFFGFKIRAGVINNLAAVKYQLQIPELKTVQIYFFT